MTEQTPAERHGARTTVRDVLGHTVTLLETSRLTHQGVGRSDLVGYRAYLGETFIGDVDSYWTEREDCTRSTAKEFAGTYPGARDWGPSGRRIDVLEDLVSHHLRQEREAAARELARLRQERESLLRNALEIQQRIDALEAKTTDPKERP